MIQPKPKTTAQPVFANSKIARVALVGVQAAGLALLLYWSFHLMQNWQYVDTYRHDAAYDGNPLLGPAYRIAIDALAIVSGALMLARSKWALLPYALHFVAYLCFLFSITGYQFDWRLYPLNALLTLSSQFLLLALLLWLEAKKGLRDWPLPVVR